MLSVEYHFVSLTHKFLARLLEKSQWSQLKLYSSEMVLTRNFSKQHLTVFLEAISGRAKGKHTVF